jgi:hypothetical protein
MTDLFEHGIQTEHSDIRAHVSASDQTVYVFRTIDGLRAIESHDPPLRGARQEGVAGPTAEGWLVSTDWISDLRRLKFWSWSKWSRFESARTTSAKGDLAVECVLELLAAGRFPLWIEAHEDQREDVQRKGADIVLFARKKIQVKCDMRVGETGNLFLQKAERNPLKRH